MYSSNTFSWSSDLSHSMFCIGVSVSDAKGIIPLKRALCANWAKRRAKDRERATNLREANYAAFPVRIRLCASLSLVIRLASFFWSSSQ